MKVHDHYFGKHEYDLGWLDSEGCDKNYIIQTVIGSKK